MAVTSRAKRAALLKHDKDTELLLPTSGHQPRETRGPIETAMTSSFTPADFIMSPAARNARPY